MQAEKVERKAEARRMRMEREPLERLLFGLFERQPRWTYPQLQVC